MSNAGPMRMQQQQQQAPLQLLCSSIPSRALLHNTKKLTTTAKPSRCRHWRHRHEHKYAPSHDLRMQLLLSCHAVPQFNHSLGQWQAPLDPPAAAAPGVARLGEHTTFLCRCICLASSRLG